LKDRTRQKIIGTKTLICTNTKAAEMIGGLCF
jgi:hypothetical protein